MVDIELSHLDLRYTDLRIRNKTQEGKLLSSIAERGIEEPLEGVDVEGGHLLLNGFKRYRCARKLNLRTVPYTCLSQDTTTAMVALLRNAQARSLSILEQAAFVDQLRTSEQLSIAEISELLCRSKAWVSMRTGLMGEMTDAIRQKLFSGAFPVYSYMYTLRQFMRMNSVSKQQIEDFIIAVSGKHLSVRQIEQLAQGYFGGSESFRQQIRTGHIGLIVEQPSHDDSAGCNRYERAVLKDLRQISTAMHRIMGIACERHLKTPAFWVQVNLLAVRILDQSDRFIQIIRRLHDRSRHT